MRWFMRDGLRLAVHEAGGTGLPVIFQHGLGATEAQVAEIFPPDPRFARVTMECRAHGASEAGEALSLGVFAGDLAALAEELGPPVAMGGISMGAALSMRLAVRRPDLVRALILVRPAWGAEAAPPNLAAVAEVAAVMATEGPRAQAAFMEGATARHLRVASPDNLASVTGYFDRAPLDLTRRLLAAIAADGPGITRADLAALRLPVLICGCDEDVIHPMALAEDLATLIPGARLVRVPPKRERAAHVAALHHAITTFLESL
jgi:pimeloyl-ACP methyl ester carboxylesterase